jgi:hypothetical protein
LWAFFISTQGARNTMAEGEQDGGQGTPGATGNAGAGAGEGQGTATPKTFTETELQREADRRVTEAQKKWKTEQEALIADKTKDAETKLAELQSKAEEAERYADFVASVTMAGVKNVKAAYLVAKGGEYFDKKGALELDRFKKENPEFFSSTTANANAGAGAGAANGTGGMNDWIRQAAGR